MSAATAYVALRIPIFSLLSALAARCYCLIRDGHRFGLTAKTGSDSCRRRSLWRRDRLQRPWTAETLLRGLHTVRQQHRRVVQRLACRAPRRVDLERIARPSRLVAKPAD